MVARYWMRDQRRKGDGLAFMRWLYKPGLGRKIIWPIVRLGMLRRKQLSDGRTVYRMPFRKALNRDAWEPSARAVEIGNQWKSIQRREVKQTFGEVEA